MWCLESRPSCCMAVPRSPDTLCGLHFSLSPQSFYQVNRTQAERLYALAAEAAGLTGEETLLDLYCGTAPSACRWPIRPGR